MISQLNRLAGTRLFRGDMDLHLVRASMVIIYFFFGYQKWFDYEAQGLIPFFTQGPLISGCIRCSESKALHFSLVLLNGCSEPYCWLVFGIESLESWVLWDQSLHLSAPSPSSRSCLTAGLPPPVDFPPWLAMSLF
jgi:hypothetical protein